MRVHESKPLWGHSGMLAALLVAAFALVATEAVAVPLPPRIRITSVHHGEVITMNHALYDDTDQTLLIGGEISGINDPADWTVTVQGVSASILSTANGFSFSLRLTIGPDPPGWPAVTTWSARWPYRLAYMDPHKIYLPVLVDLVENKTDDVVDRKRITLLDMRGYPPDRAAAYWSDPVLDEAAGIQLSSSGVAALTPVHEHALPHPDLATFNATLTSQALLQPSGRLLFSGGQEPCLELSGDSPLTDTSAYQNALIAANAVYGIYLTCKAVSPSGCDALCVTSLPRARHFEVCVGRIDAEMLSASVDGLDSANLSLDTAAEALSVDLRLDGVEADVRVVLSDLSIRYKKNVCAVPIRFDLDWSDLAEVDAWRTCEPARIWADGAHTEVPIGMSTPILFDPLPAACPDAAAQDKECVEVHQVQASNFELTGNLGSFSNTGTCAEDFISADADATLTELMPRLADAVTDAWGKAAPLTEHAAALDELLEPIEIGAVPTDAHDLVAVFSDPEYHPSGLLRYDWQTSAYPPQASVIPTPTSHIYVFNEPMPLDLSGISPNNQSFDVSYTVTTGMLNQIIRAQVPGKLYFRKKFKKLSKTAKALAKVMKTCAKKQKKKAKKQRKQKKKKKQKKHGKKKKKQNPPATPLPVPPAANPGGTQTLPANQPPAGGAPQNNPTPQPTVPGPQPTNPNPTPAIPTPGGGIKPAPLCPTTGLPTTLTLDKIVVTFQPFLLSPATYLPLDVGVPDPEGMPMYFDGANFLVSFVKKGKKGAPDTLLLQFVVDFYDRSFDLRLPAASDPEASFLIPSWDVNTWWFKQIYSALPGCPTRHFGTSPCAVKLESVLRPVLEERMRALLSEVPTPHYFDAAGHTNYGLYLRSVDRVQRNQNVTLYGEFVY